MSEQVVPSPSYPVLQAQLELPSELVQVALVSHPPLLVRHSSMSEQVVPSPS